MLPTAVLALVSPRTFSCEPWHALELTRRSIVHQVLYSQVAVELEPSRPPLLVASLLPFSTCLGKAPVELAIFFWTLPAFSRPF